MPRKSPTEKWRDTLTKPHKTLFAWLPHSPRCSICGIPFSGAGGAVSRMVGYRRWNKNPTLCNMCMFSMPKGGAEVDIAVLFADLRGSTGLAERLGPTAFADLLNRFYKVATEVLAPHRAIIDKMIGDEVMAFFYAGASGLGYRQSAVSAAVGIMRRFPEAIPQENVLGLGIGLNAGTAFVGKVGEGEVLDFTALGDTVNVAARLQAEAKGGELVLSEDLYQSAAATDYPRLEQRTLQVRGRVEPMTVRVLRLA